MRVKFEEQLEKLNVMLIDMGALCEEAIGYAVKALEEDSREMCEKTMLTDETIEERQREIEAACLKLLLQQQPVASDLRLVSASIKMIGDMERIGDQACDIAEIAKTLKNDSDSFNREMISSMAEAVTDMVKKSVDSYIRKDIKLANDVIIKDDVVDNFFDSVRDELIKAVSVDSSCGEYFVDILMIAKYLERIGDHAVNISRWVIYSITGEHVGKEPIEEGTI